MFCVGVLPSRGARSTDGELIGQALLEFRPGSPKTRILRTLDLVAFVKLVPIRMGEV